MFWGLCLVVCCVTFLSSCGFCFVGVACWYPVVGWVGCACTLAVLSSVLCWYSGSTLGVLCQYCASTVPVLWQYCPSPLLQTHTTHVSACNQFWPLRQTQHKHTHIAQPNTLAQHMCALLRVEQQFLGDLDFPNSFFDFWIKARRCPLFYIVQEIMLNLLSHLAFPQKNKNSAQQAVNF